MTWAETSCLDSPFQFECACCGQSRRSWGWKGLLSFGSWLWSWSLTLHVCSAQLGTRNWMGLRNPDASFLLMDLKNLTARTQTDRNTCPPTWDQVGSGPIRAYSPAVGSSHMSYYKGVMRHELFTHGCLDGDTHAHTCKPICVHTLPQHRIHV